MNRDPLRPMMPSEADFAKMKAMARDPKCIAELTAMGAQLDPQFVQDMTERLARITSNDTGRRDH